ADGDPVGGEFQVNSFIPGSQTQPSVAVLESGGFVVTWSSFGQDGSGSGIFGQRFDADGDPVGAEFPVNTTTLNNQQDSGVVGLDDGGFMVIWETGSGSGPTDIIGRRFDADGNPVSGEVLINETVAGFQLNAGFNGGKFVDQLASGDIVVAWTGEPFVDSQEIYARLFSISPAVSASLDLAPLVDFGADGPADMDAFALKDATQLGPSSGPLAVMATDENGDPVSPLTSMGDDVFFTGFDDSVSGEITLTATAAGRDIFTVTLTEAGEITFTILDNIDHPLTNDPATGDLETAFADRLFLDFGALINVTDGDGDTIMLNGQVIFKVTDDIPEAVGMVMATVDEADIPDQVSQPTPTSATIDLALFVDFGVDGQGAVPFALKDATALGDPAGAVTVRDENGAPVALTSMGDPVLYTGFDTSVAGQTTLTATADGRTVFTLTLTDAGQITFNLFDTIDHPLTDDPGTNEDETAFEDRLFIDVGALINATDGDGDQFMLAAEQVVFKVTDDIPEASGMAMATL
ncbi:MAG: hypothetical protein MI861_22920, partial [Pirellulales bacterium]|nr:hypothetical protein [Pirellulales bacterium]